MRLMLCVNPGAAVHYGREHISSKGWNTGIPITLSPPKQNDLELLAAALFFQSPYSHQINYSVCLTACRLANMSFQVIAFLQPEDSTKIVVGQCCPGHHRGGLMIVPKPSSPLDHPPKLDTE